ncbi:MAG: NUDIX hydrolase [Myxococcota bacterium]
MPGRDPSAPPPPRDSATVLLLREGEAGFEVFLVRRHGKSAFMGGAHVFPGGTVDPQDRDPALWALASGHSPDTAADALGEEDRDRSMALYCAAIRETFEEAGVLLAAEPAAETELRQARRRLVAGTPFAPLVRELGVGLGLDRLVPHSRWITPVVEPRRYDARFLVAAVPAGQQAEHDRLETTAGAWVTPPAALERERAGEIQLPPPTLRTLEALAAHGSVEAVLREARARRPRPILPVFHPVGDALVLSLPGDPDHPESERALPGPTRLVLENGRWRSRDPAG